MDFQFSKKFKHVDRNIILRYMAYKNENRSYIKNKTT
jgi:hypothetical protein